MITPTLTYAILIEDAAKEPGRTCYESTLIQATAAIVTCSQRQGKQIVIPLTCSWFAYLASQLIVARSY